jgi:hypothetical protein
MNKIDYALIQLEGTLTVSFEEYIDCYFNEPIEIDCKNIGLSSLYAWRNGNKIEEISKDDSYEFCSFGYFLPFDVGLNFMKSNEDYFLFGKRKLFPIISNFKGEFLLVDISDTKSPVFILSPSLMITEPEIIFKSIDVMILSFAVCFGKNAYSFIEKKLVIDFDMESAIVQKYDNSSFWKNE